MNLPFYFRVLKTYINYRRGKPTPANISLRLVYRCNLKCTFCQFWKIKGTEESSLEQVKRLIDDLAMLGLPYFNITGGEPLLRPDLEEIAAYAAEKGIFLALNTNATLMTRNRARDLARTFNIIKISLDGFEKTHDSIRGIEGAFQRANAGINKLLEVKDRKAKVIIHLVANDKNLDEIPEFVKKYDAIADQISVMPHFEIVSNVIFDKPEFIDTWKTVDKTYTLNESESMITKPNLDEGKKICDAANLYYSVLPDGKVICCPHLPLELGNIKEHSFYEIWSRKLTEGQKNEINKCNGCYAKCTTEVSKFMRKSPVEVLLDAPRMIKKHML